MLVVNGVELAILDQFPHIWHFDHCEAVLFEDRCNPANKAVGVRNMGQHVIGDHHVGAFTLFYKLLGQGLSKELAACGHACRTCCASLGGAGSIPSTSTPASTKLRKR